MLPQDASTRYAAWLVDLDGTLYRQTPVKFAMAAELLLFGWGSIQTLRTFRHAHEALRQQSYGSALALSPFQRQLEHAAECLGRPSSDVERIVREWMFERPLKWVARAKRQALLDALRGYRAQGGKTALVSDYPASGKLRALGALELFDLVISSGEDGGPSKLKPDPEGYLSAASRLGIEPARCLVIGDRDDADGAAARAAGMGLCIIR
ncbi:MAG TPA: HAD family hydrolase [Polyangiaceae bacterium]|nr:HAD family hydrolase [Polyangiaceae bacterium]